MEETPWIERYFWFGMYPFACGQPEISLANPSFRAGAMPDLQKTGVNPLNSLMGSGGKPTTLGKMYISGD